MNDIALGHMNDISIVLCGEAGQGIKTVEYLLTKVLKRAGYNIFATKEYMSRIRGGANSTEIRVSSERVNGFVNRIDLLIPIGLASLERLRNRITDRTHILGEKQAHPDFASVVDIPFAEIAKEIGGDVYANTLAAGLIVGLLNVETDLLASIVSALFAGKPQDVIDKNLKAAEKGHEIGSKMRDSGDIRIEIDRSQSTADELLTSGAEAVAMGAIAGGCNFTFSYPMSPSTGVLTFLAQHCHDFGIVVEQAEDEICAINAGLGAWYAGARAIVTTSGGGFALMEEGTSLAGMTETPMVIHVAQRPGPATGLPTRTGQEDLELVLHSGHGEFPRVILAPGTLEDGFYLTQHAFNLADRFQVPVFILTDQYYMDSQYNVPAFDLSRQLNENQFVETESDYRRYEITDDGISPRGIPGFGKGIVSVDSDEHDVEGHITEDLDLRIKMVDKRLRKMASIKKAAIAPELIGNTDYKVLVLSWGSTRNIVSEAIQETGRDDITLLHFKQVYPLHESTREMLDRAALVVSVENNATGQFANLIKREIGFSVHKEILKYNGLPFSKEEIATELRRLGTGPA